jgi:hypothetical protein
VPLCGVGDMMCETDETNGEVLTAEVVVCMDGVGDAATPIGAGSLF